MHPHQLITQISSFLTLLVSSVASILWLELTVCGAKAKGFHNIMSQLYILKASYNIMQYFLFLGQTVAATSTITSSYSLVSVSSTTATLVISTAGMTPSNSGKYML